MNSLLGLTYRYRTLRESRIKRSLACNAAVAVRTVAGKGLDAWPKVHADAAVLARAIPAAVEGEGAAGAAADGAGLG